MEDERDFAFTPRRCPKKSSDQGGSCHHNMKKNVGSSVEGFARWFLIVLHMKILDVLGVVAGSRLKTFSMKIAIKNVLV
ncbi:hypothetical protein CHUAL_011339 [Chamberlinius hualienensis]